MYTVILNVHASVVLVLSILEHLCLHRDLNKHISVVLVLFILEDLCLPRDFICTCTSVVSVDHSRAPVFTP